MQKKRRKAEASGGREQAFAEEKTQAETQFPPLILLRQGCVFPFSLIPLVLRRPSPPRFPLVHPLSPFLFSAARDTRARFRAAHTHTEDNAVDFVCARCFLFRCVTVLPPLSPLSLRLPSPSLSPRLLLPIGAPFLQQGFAAAASSALRVPLVSLTTKGAHHDSRLLLQHTHAFFSPSFSTL